MLLLVLLLLLFGGEILDAWLASFGQLIVFVVLCLLLFLWRFQVVCSENEKCASETGFNWVTGPTWPCMKECIM